MLRITNATTSIKLEEVIIDRDVTVTTNNNNHSLIYFLLAIMAVLMIVIVTSVYSTGSRLEELIIDYGEQIERTHSDITNRLAELQQR